MKKQIFLLCICCCTGMHIFSQSLFTYGANEVSKEEFIRAFNRNINNGESREASLKEYLELYSKFKLKVTAAKELKLDTMSQLKYDMMNFRTRLEDDYMVGINEIFTKINFKKNPAADEAMLLLYADSAAYSKDKRVLPVAKEVMFSIAGVPVKGEEWLNFAKAFKLDQNQYKGESNAALMEKFINQTATAYFRKHLEEYNADFKYQLQEFKEGNLFYEVMGKKVWNRQGNDATAIKEFYEANKSHFLWNESAEVILVNAKSFAYADFAFENMKNGQYWKDIAGQSEGMIQGDSAQYELAQLPVKQGTKLAEGAILEIVKSNTDNSASFVKVIRVFPPKMQMSFEEAKSLVINEYQQKLEENWMKELTAKYPVKINTLVFQSLLK